MSVVHRFVAVISLSALLAGCANGSIGWPGATNTPPIAEGVIESAQPGQMAERVKIAMLLPLSGQNASLGEAMLQSAQLAVSDLKETNVDIVPYDTKGTTDGAANGVEAAVQSNANLILGPVTSAEVQALKSASTGKALTVLTFSTDWRQAGGNVISLGILPFDQASRMARYAAQQGKKSVLIVRAKDTYGDATAQAFKKTAAAQNITISGDITPEALASFTGAFDAVFMPLSGAQLHTALKALKAKQGNKPLLMGTGLWDDPSVKNIADLKGAVYAAPSAAFRARYEQNYRATFGATPPRLASLAYDGTALAIMVARMTSNGMYKPDLSRGQLTNPNGFAGIDGLLRLKADGTNERGLAVHQIVPGGTRVLEEAPQSFM